MSDEQVAHARNAWLRAQTRLGVMSERRRHSEFTKFVTAYAKAFAHKADDVRKVVVEKPAPKPETTKDKRRR